LVTSRGTYRRYSDADRAKALATLAANGGNADQTAKQLGIPVSTLKDWATGTCHPEARRNSVAEKEILADRYERLTHAALDVTEEGMKRLTPRDAATVAGIFTDKMQNLRGGGPPAGVVVVIKVVSGDWVDDL